MSERASPMGVSADRAKQLHDSGVRKSDKSIFGDLLRKGHDEDFEPTKVPMPTAFAPGSVGKIHVLSQRLQNGEELYHPGDEKCAVSNLGRAFIKRGVQS